MQSRHGPLSRVTPPVQEQIGAEVGQQPDVTLKELQPRLQTTAGVSLRRSLLGGWLQRLGLRRKKNRSTRRSGTRKPTASGGKSFSPGSPPSRRKS